MAAHAAFFSILGEFDYLELNLYVITIQHEGQ